MIAYEFETEIQDGMIKIPDDLTINRKGRFRVVLIKEDRDADQMKEALLKAPVWSEEDVSEFKDIIAKGYQNINILNLKTFL
jgi:hypothetical protein